MADYEELYDDGLDDLSGEEPEEDTEETESPEKNRIASGWPLARAICSA